MEANYSTDTHEASRGLSAIAELLEYLSVRRDCPLVR